MLSISEAQRKILCRQVETNCSLSGLEGVPEERIVEEFRRNHKLTTFDDYRDKIATAVEAGKAGDGEVFRTAAREVTTDPWIQIHCTSGTTGSSKYYPFNAAKVPIVEKFFLFHRFMTIPRNQTLDLTMPGKVETLSVGVIMGGVLSCYQHSAKSSGRVDPFTSSMVPLSFKFAGRSLAVYHLCWLVALLNFEDVLCITDAFAGNLVIACNWLLENWRVLEAEILSAELDVNSVEVDIASEAIREEAVKLLAETDERRREKAIRQLQKACGGKEDRQQRKGALRRLFPNLIEMRCIKTGSMAKYVPHLEELVADTPPPPPAPLGDEETGGRGGVRIVSSLYGGTEGFYGFAVDPPEDSSQMPSEELLASFSAFFPALMKHAAASANSAVAERGQRGVEVEDSYALLPDLECFFEFIPLESDSQIEQNGGGDGNQGSAGPVEEREETETDTQQPRLLHELEEGKLYELVISNFSGVARHRIGDIIRVVRILPEECGRLPMVTVVGRSGQALNLVWEKMPEHHVLSAVREVTLKCSFPLRDFCATESIADGLLPFYHFYVEAKEEEKEGESLKKAKNLLPELRDALETALCARNDPYSDFITNSKVARLRLSLVKRGTFSKMREHTVASSLTVYSQYKSPTVVRDGVRLDVLKASVLVTAVARGGAPAKKSRGQRRHLTDVSIETEERSLPPVS
uniref:Uncharacterized protein n=1 Tax=Chromera velia CCMP2878 TaxID=1169474 RepID=A0A0G4G312_9ALVE|eukprot:Cvel_20009.t1-p1 / transcript=Cvel_20009.t1 / gene=Cvel_20009 / organism=Chromera_velia_CCMP2878 / gene_product=Indole-3-acetic acid-amido synthetase GH3.17, putative / transcript_product=Indole-3-acetic acid-amido synthetase GH3.17, putative / location=Cvel_scaffold1764:32377-36730(+) / protein_length=691 / sequence_SO=supercontig / SO=protein_coding / is_pseudo=false